MRVVRFRPSDQHDSEASFVSHHPSVSFGSICQRNGFDHRTDLLQGAKGKRVLGIYRRAGHRSRQRTQLIGSSPPAPAKISWRRKLSELAARSKSASEKNSAPE